MIGCIDLAARFGDRFRLTWEADGLTKPFWPREEWPWLRRVCCRYGVIYPMGSALLAAFTERSRIGTQLRALPCVLRARGDVETVVVFHVDDIEAVLAILRPYRRRRLSVSARIELVSKGGATRFRTADRDGVESDFLAPQSPQAPDPRPGPADAFPTPETSGSRAREQVIFERGGPNREPPRLLAQCRFESGPGPRALPAPADPAIAQSSPARSAPTRRGNQGMPVASHRPEAEGGEDSGR